MAAQQQAVYKTVVKAGECCMLAPKFSDSEVQSVFIKQCLPKPEAVRHAAEAACTSQHVKALAKPPAQ